MRSFALALVCGLTAAGGYGGRNTSYGTTGHFGNQYGHGGNDDHNHDDHKYGYDSVPNQKALLSGTPLTRNENKRDDIIDNVTLANTARKEYLQDVHDRRVQRLAEVHQQNIREIEGPFDYQIDLLDKEEDDITVALTEAIMDSNAAYTDMLSRIDRLYQDKVAGLTREINQIKDAIDRSGVDRKDACEVLFSLRLDILKNIDCDSNGGAATYDNTDTLEFRHYEGMFDDFHYDIGHGKGTGEGKLDSAPVSDGYSGSQPEWGPVGDYEVDVGASTRSWEGNLYSQGG